MLTKLTSHYLYIQKASILFIISEKKNICAKVQYQIHRRNNFHLGSLTLFFINDSVSDYNLYLHFWLLQPTLKFRAVNASDIQHKQAAVKHFKQTTLHALLLNFVEICLK